MFKKILFPISDLETAKKTINYVKDIAKTNHSEVILLSSFDLAIVSPGPLVFGLDNQNQEDALYAYQCVLDEIKIKLEKVDIQVKIKLEKGEPGPVICRIAESEKCDLIIMGKRELTTIKSYLLGSVSNYVVHHTSCPLLLIEVTPT